MLLLSPLFVGSFGFKASPSKPAAAKINDKLGTALPPPPKPLFLLGRWQPPWCKLSAEGRAAAELLGWNGELDWDDDVRRCPYSSAASHALPVMRFF